MLSPGTKPYPSAEKTQEPSSHHNPELSQYFTRKKGLCQGMGGEQINYSTLDEVTGGAAEVGDDVPDAKWLTSARMTSAQSLSGPTPRWAQRGKDP